jgi:hypothetical protein
LSPVGRFRLEVLSYSAVMRRVPHYSPRVRMMRHGPRR